MACTVIHGSAPLSTGLLWRPASKTAAMRILDERLQAHLRQSTAAAPTPAKAPTCGDLWLEFVRVRWPRLSRNKQAEYQRYFDLVPPALLCTDTAGIRTAVRKAVDASTYAPNTKNKVYVRIRTVFKFGIDEGYLTVNPIHRDMIPAFEHAIPTPYTHDEVMTVHKLSDASKYKPFLLFLIGSGCRPVEGLRLEWEHVYDDHCVVYSYKNGRRSARFRVIPFELCPLVREALALAKAQGSAPPGRVFRMQNYIKASQTFNELVGPSGRGLYDIRKYAINKWKREGWPEVVRHAVAGHDEEIAEVHYETDYTAAELVSITLASNSKK
jgi:integrase